MSDYFHRKKYNAQLKMQTPLTQGSHTSSFSRSEEVAVAKWLVLPECTEGGLPDSAQCDVIHGGGVNVFPA